MSEMGLTISSVCPGCGLVHSSGDGLWLLVLPCEGILQQFMELDVVYLEEP